MLDGPFGMHPFFKIERMCDLLIKAQGKTVITDKFVKQVRKYYENKLLNTATYLKYKETRELVLGLSWKEIETRYPQKQLQEVYEKDLKDDNARYMNSRKRALGNVSIKYFHENKQDYVKNFLYELGGHESHDWSDGEFFTLSDVNIVTIDLSEHSDEIMYLKTLCYQFRNDYQKVIYNLENILKAHLTVEDVLKSLPELADVEFDLATETDQYIEKFNSIFDKLNEVS